MNKILHIGILFLFSLSLFSQNKSKYDSAFYKTYNYMEVDKYYNAEKLIDSVLLKLKSTNNKFEKGRFLTLKAAVYEALEEFKKSEKLNLQAMELFKSINEDYYYNWTLIILLNNYMVNDEFDMFFELLPKAKIRNKNDFFIFFVYQSELEVYFKQKKYTKVLKIVDKMITKLDTTQFKAKQYEKETYSYRAMYKIFKAFSLMETDNKEQAKPLFNEILKINFKEMFWLDEDVLQYEPDIYRYKYELMYENNQKDSLQYYHNKYVEKNKELLNFVKIKIKKNKKILMQLLENDKKIVEENMQLKIEQQKKRSFMIFILSVFFIGFSIWFGFVKNKNARIIENKNVRIKKLNTALEQNIFELEQKNVKNQELILLTERSIFSKTIQISTLRDKIKKIVLELTQAIKNGDNINIVNLFRIENSLKSIITENEIWEEFKFQFENIRPNFFKKLKELNPNLSVNDLKHCAYVATNLKTKDVANLIYVSPRSVETIRYRLRKKLYIPKNIKLYDFLRSIDE